MAANSSLYLLPLPTATKLRSYSDATVSLRHHHRRLFFPRLPSSSLRAEKFRCMVGQQTGFFSRLGRLIKEKAKSDVKKIFSGFTKTRDNLAVINELLLYWNLEETYRVLDELEEALLVSNFGPRITIKTVDTLREEILSGKLKSGSEIKDALKKAVLDLVINQGTKTELQLGFSVSNPSFSYLWQQVTHLELLLVIRKMRTFEID